MCSKVPLPSALTLAKNFSGREMARVGAQTLQNPEATSVGSFAWVDDNWCGWTGVSSRQGSTQDKPGGIRPLHLAASFFGRTRCNRETRRRRRGCSRRGLGGSSLRGAHSGRCCDPLLSADDSVSCRRGPCGGTAAAQLTLARLPSPQDAALGANSLIVEMQLPGMHLAHVLPRVHRSDMPKKSSAAPRSERPRGTPQAGQ